MLAHSQKLTTNTVTERISNHYPLNKIVSFKNTYNKIIIIETCNKYDVELHLG